jgi:hypothetical protein
MGKDCVKKQLIGLLKPLSINLFNSKILIL